MRPLRIQMLGFGTFRDETEVDFVDLELVALVGGTGSGKSTIIDAITFALFGRVARLDAGSVAPVINALSTEARLVFEFESAGRTYTAARVVRRRGEGATTKEARLESDGEVLAEGPKEIAAHVEQLLGLNFDRFTRVVVLPQGKFAAFLHDKPGDRQQLMRRLLDLGIYERLGSRARSLSKEASAQLDVLRPKLEAGGVSDDDLAALKQEHAAVAATKVALDQALAQRAEAIEARDALARRADDFGVLVLAVADVEVPQQALELGDKLDAAETERKVADKLVADAEAAVDAAAKACVNGPDMHESRQLLGVHSDLVGAVALAKELGVAVTKAQAARDGAAAQVVELEAKLTEADEQVAAAEAAEKTALDAVAGGPSRSDVDNARGVLMAVSGTEAEVAPAETAATAAAKASEKAASKLSAAETQLLEATAEVRRVETDNHAHVLVGTLVAGEPCPVCQQPVGEIPDVEPTGELADATAAEAAAKEAVAEERSAAIDADKQHAATESRLADVVARRNQARQEADAVPAASELDKQTERIEAVGKKAKAATVAREEASKAARVLRDSAELKAARAEASETASAVAATMAELASNERRLVELQTQVEGKPSKAELTKMVEQAEALASEHNQVMAAEKRAEKASAKATQAVIELRRSEAELRQQFTKSWAAFVGIDPPQPQNTSLLVDWQAFADWAKSQQEPLEQEHAKASHIAETATSKVTEAEAANRELVAEQEGAASCEIDALSTFFVDLLARTKAAVEHAERRRKELEADAEQVKQLEESQQVHDMLGNRLLKSSGFEQWLMEEVVQALVDRASARLFELSGGQYSIESEDMDFMVRDHRNGDELRDARTLSGGETFLASLALALALADSLHAMAPEGTPPLESLFLDEGFGTLDPETLDVVAAAIEELGASGRMVGIITHIRELAERMPVRFEVSKEATSSVVARVEA